MKTYVVKVNGFHEEVRAESIDNVRKSFMRSGNRYPGFLAWVSESGPYGNHLGQVRYDASRGRFVWYRDARAVNVLNRDGSLGRRL